MSDVLRLELSLANLRAKFSEDQPRDDHGRWSAGGGGATSTADLRAPLANYSVRYSQQDLSVQTVAYLHVEGKDGTDVGTISYNPNTPKGEGIMVDTIYVDPANRGQGIAVAMAAELHDHTGEDLVWGSFASKEGIQLGVFMASHYPDWNTLWLGNGETWKPGDPIPSDASTFAPMAYGTEGGIQPAIAAGQLAAGLDPFLAKHEFDQFFADHALWKYDDSQPRDDSGRWTSDGGGGGTTGPDPNATHAALYGDHAGTPTDPVPCGSDIERAAKIIADGGNVSLNQPQEIATLLDKMQEIGKEAEAKGEKAPTFDLCDVSVPGTNLFCQDHVVDDQGNPLDRIQMPQLVTTDPVPGSPADQLPRNQFGEVDMSTKFAEFLSETGRPPVEETVDAATLRASQDQLNGAKVAGIVDAIQAGTYDVTTGRIWITNDNYVIDGHHRWAAAVTEGYATGQPVELPVRRLDMNIGTALTTANYWTEEQGIQGRSLTAKHRFAIAAAALGISIAKFSDDESRDDRGRWTADGGSGPAYGSGGTTPQRGDAVTLQDGRAAVVNGPAQDGRVSVIVDGSRRGSTAAVDSLSPRSEPAPGDATWYGGIEPVSYATTDTQPSASVTETGAAGAPTDAADINTLESDRGLVQPIDYLVDPNDPEGETGLDVMNWYAGSYAINQDIRDGSISGEDVNRMHQLDSMIAASSTTQDYVAMRGTQLDPELVGLTPEQMVGKTYSEPGFVSTASPTAAEGYAATSYLYPEGTNLEGTTAGPPVLARVLMPDGTHLAIDTQEGETEAVLPRDTSFTVTSAETREDIAGLGAYTYLEVTADTSKAPGSKNHRLSLDMLETFGFSMKYSDNQERDDHGRWTSGGSIGVVEKVPVSPKFPEPRELPTYGLTPAAQEALYAKCEAKGITHDELTNEISSRIGGPDAAVITQAGEWYQQAHDLAGTMAADSNGRITQDQAEAVIAAISPRESWDANVLEAQRITDFYASGAADGMTPEQAVLAMRDAQPEGEQFRALPDNMVKAVQVLQGASPDEALAGLKVRSFFDNISDPGGTREVTIDGHMLKAFSAVSDTITDKGAAQLLNQSSRTEGAQYAGAGYIALSEAVRSVSTQWSLPPDTVQAAYWLSVRDLDWNEMKP